MVVAPAVDGRPQHLGQEVHVRPRGVHGRELDVVRAQRHAQLHHLPGHLQHLVPGLPDLVLQMDVGGGDERVDARPLGVLDGLPAGADVALHAARQAADHGALDLAGDGLDRLEIALAGGGEAGLDHVHAQTHQLVGYLELLRPVQTDPRGLLAVAQGGIEEDYGRPWLRRAPGCPAGPASSALACSRT